MQPRAVPTKWQKYLRLVNYDLISLETLESEIHRYPWAERSKLINDIRKDIYAESASGEKNIYVVKLVPMRQEGQLPNFRVTEESDIDQLFDFFKNYNLNAFEEVWYCKTRIDASIFSVAGRIIFATSSFPKAQTVEQVWRCSPRMLERLSSDFAWPYVRAFRQGWGRRFYTEFVHIPQTDNLSHFDLEREFIHSMHQLERFRERIEFFCSSLDQYQFRAYSLEYKLVGEKVSIIDWDTPNDLRVLGS